LLNHNAEPDAVDLLEELEIVDEIVGLVDENTFSRVCQYMIRFVLTSCVACISRSCSFDLMIDVSTSSLPQTISTL
jgi:hypothetical protein